MLAGSPLAARTTSDDLSRHLTPFWWNVETQSRVNASAAAANRQATASLKDSVTQVHAFDKQERRSLSDNARLQVNLWGDEEQRRNLALNAEHCYELLQKQLNHIHELEAQNKAAEEVNQQLAARLRDAEQQAAMVSPLEQDCIRLQKEMRRAQAEEARLTPIAAKVGVQAAQLAHFEASHDALCQRLGVAESQEARVPELESVNQRLQERLRKVKENKDRMDYLEKTNNQLRMQVKVAEKRALTFQEKAGGSRATGPKAQPKKQQRSPVNGPKSVEQVATGEDVDVPGGPGSMMEDKRVNALEIENRELRIRLTEVTKLLEELSEPNTKITR